MTTLVLLPPALPMLFPRCQTVSDTNDPPGPLVVSVVPPTCVIFGLSSGKGIAPENASPSPLAAKKDCPWAAICKNMFSAVPLDAPPDQEQLNCLDTLSLAMRLNKSDHGLGLGASYT